MENYFTKFPTLYYNNLLCADITRKVKIVDTYLRTPTSYYNYEVENANRPDIISNFVYNDPYLDWTIYLVNETIDPYYEWPMEYNDFNDFIKTKYGSVEESIKKTKFYRNAWYNDPNEISYSFYENTLALNHKKYYTPNFGMGTKIISYKRKEEDWVVNTNKIFRWNITYNTGNSFTNGEIIDLKYSANTIGTAEVITSNSTTLTFQHISGTVNSSIVAVGETSITNASFTTVAFEHENISDDEFVYWERVSLYDYENELNEQKKHIKLIDSAYTLDLAESLRDSLRKN
jgi:hypothetical protein